MLNIIDFLIIFFIVFLSGVCWILVNWVIIITVRISTYCYRRKQWVRQRVAFIPNFEGSSYSSNEINVAALETLP